MKENVFVLFTFELPHEFSHVEVVREILVNLGWKFKAGEVNLPGNTCVKKFPQLDEQAAASAALEEIEKVILAIRHVGGVENFKFSNFLFLAHQSPPAQIIYGKSLNPSEKSFVLKNDDSSKKTKKKVATTAKKRQSR